MDGLDSMVGHVVGCGREVHGGREERSRGLRGQMWSAMAWNGAEWAAIHQSAPKELRKTLFHPKAPILVNMRQNGA